MTRSRKIFLGLVILFFASLVALVIDISSKTTFPGPKSREKGPVEQDIQVPGDTVKRDSTVKSTI